MEPKKELDAALFWERVRQARQMPPEEKLFAGNRLFDEECRRMMDDIRHEYPDADEARVREILNERLAIAQRLEETRSGLYVSITANEES